MKITEVKKKNGATVYRASVYLGVDQVTGKKVKTKVTGRTQKEVKQKAKQEKIAFQQDGFTRFQATSIASYQELAELWWESYKHTVKPNTQDNVKKLLDNHVLPLFGVYKLDKLTTPLIQSIVNKLADKTNKGEPGAYLHYDKIHALNKRILQYGVTMQAIPANPARDVVLPRNTQKAKRKKVKHFENQDLKKFLDYLGGLDLSKYRNLYEATLYKFLLATGCRINEALALSWSDIDLENATISITKTLNHLGQINSPKSKASYRDIDIDQATITMLKAYQLRQIQEAWKLGRTETVVFSDFIHDYPSNKTLGTRLKTRFKRAGVPNIGFHGFRHTHASLLLNSGIPYKELQYRLGHSTLSMTMDIYSHLSKENAKKAVSFYETALKAL
ncbi:MULTISPECIES: tyrosine-type recombinase/integrase [Streptococcus]|uniref:tyrosine-type recombinase/integrase n=1 Tax=Streptococcus TaxID=1301 RepID=UPI0010A10F6B|nr:MULTISPECIES: site-specific integrase [Streptococcus]TYL00368.1 site-specific integrase [Streptococcus dysgalactiae]VGY20229.1 prophage Sa05, site-specific recombinase phage integrase [Streptococcus pyogenes]VGY22087.1 prophage Sa05, site-specific recombinase phage integrase [Streptococcus pyogenes]VGY41569.1 prophage Sa05, site-specific recombinase phage integrase [Streptococcus pyogenes]VGZ68627.1 prophage Sa05, site-specific recombinase phage integrase [Streptococcus pyogenes]